MDKEIIDEINYEIQVLLKSGFYDNDEILEIIEDEFFEEDISLDEISNLVNLNYDSSDIKQNSVDFIKLKDVFNQLTGLNDIITIHNAGYGIEEGVQDAFELFVHLRNNNFNPKGFCFYSLEDIEIAIEENSLSIAFGDFENNENLALYIGKIVEEALKSNGFDINWDSSIDNPIVINNFDWTKIYDDEEYSMDGALKTYLEFH